jgi:8-oxo-dGTP pyrophosphatase MutT (NUDIX family)
MKGGAGMSAPVVRHVDDARFALDAAAWPLAQARRADIDGHFAAMRRARPQLWNGPVLLFRDVACQGGLVTGRAFETDFASLMWWRDNGFPDAAIRNVFGMAAVRGTDGGFLLGVMGAHTSNAGQAYFPAGTPDPKDLSGDSVDIAGSVARELKEETGLDAATLTAAPGWTAVLAGPRVALIKAFNAKEPCEALLARVRAHIKADPAAELADAVVVRRRADIPAAAPDFMRAFLETALAG